MIVITANVYIGMVMSCPFADVYLGCLIAVAAVAENLDTDQAGPEVDYHNPVFLVSKGCLDVDDLDLVGIRLLYIPGLSAETA
jgi:hypothetical protein